MKRFLFIVFSTALLLAFGASALMGATPAAAEKPATHTPKPDQATKAADKATEKAADPTKDSPQWGLTPHAGGVSLGATNKATVVVDVVIQPANTQVPIDPTTGSPMLNIQPSNTPLPTATNTPIPANKLAKSFCDQLNDAGVKPEKPLFVGPLELWARYGPWGFAWKDNQSGRSRTWPIACKWIADKSAKGGKWSQEPMDPSNSHIQDSYPNNDFTAWMNKLRGPYEDYKKGWLRFP